MNENEDREGQNNNAIPTGALLPETGKHQRRNPVRNLDLENFRKPENSMRDKGKAGKYSGQIMILKDKSGNGKSSKSAHKDAISDSAVMPDTLIHCSDRLPDDGITVDVSASGDEFMDTEQSSESEADVDENSTQTEDSSSGSSSTESDLSSDGDVRQSRKVYKRR